MEVISTISGVTTNDYRQILDSFRVKVIIPNKLKDNDNISESCYIILNLLPRFLKLVRLEGDTSILQRFPLSHSSKINIGNDKWESDISIILDPEQTDDNSLYVSSSGWSVYISTQESCKWQSSKNNLSAIYAGALAVGEVFKEFVKKITPEDTNLEKITHLEYDLIAHGSEKQPVLHPELPEFIDVENTLLAGCGAVGQAICYCLSKSGKLIGEIELVDNDVMDLSNEQRYLFGFEENRINPKTNAPMLKTEIAQTLLRNSSLSLVVKNLGMQYELFEKLRGGIRKNTDAIAALDKIRPRLLLQASFPKTLWNVWTDTEKNISSYGIGRHTIDGNNACLACEYFPKDSDVSEVDLIVSRTGFDKEQVKLRLQTNNVVTPQDVFIIAQNRKLPPNEIMLLNKAIGQTFNDLIHGNCGVFQLNVDEEHAPTPAPHVPVLAAVQVSTQFVLSKIGHDDKVIDSIAEFDALRWPTINSVFIKQKHPDCICSDPDYVKTFQQKWN